MRLAPALILSLSALGAAAQDMPAAPPAEARTAFVTMHTDVRALQLYREACLQRIMGAAHGRLPRDADGRVLPDRVLLSLEIAPDGSLAASRVLQGSASRLLTASALDMVRAAAPFPAFPGVIARDYDRVVLTLPLDFGG